jgi:hypothetical protein
VSSASIVHAADALAGERKILEEAIILAGLQSVRPRIVLTSELLAARTQGVEGWTVIGEDGKGYQIFVYTRSRTFQCASGRQNANQCLLKLASVIVHEAWHLKYGPDEAAAYTAQEAFLEFNHASPLLITEIRQARRRVLSRGAR